MSVQDSKLERLQRKLQAFEQNFYAVMERYPEDSRKTLLCELVATLCTAIARHAALIVEEGNDRFQISERDYHAILNEYIPLFNEIKTLPRARPGSVYEISLATDLDVILKSHCEGEDVE